MKRLLIATMLVCSVLAAQADGPTPAAPSSAKPFDPSTFKPSSWSLYYGNWRPDMVDRLVADLVVVDPAALGGKADEVIAAFKARGCRVVGYLSCFEVAKWHRYLPRVKEEWRVKVDGKNWVPWGANEAISLAEPEWRDMLVSLMKSEVFDHGCEGVFMDTLADLDNPSLPEEERVRQLDGLGKFAAAFRAAYPDKLFIANWTLQRSLPPLAPYINAVCWEDFAPKHFGGATRGWMEGIARGIEAQRAKHPFLVLTLWDSAAPAPGSVPAAQATGDDAPTPQDEMRRISVEHGYLPYCTIGGYRELR